MAHTKKTLKGHIGLNPHAGQHGKKGQFWGVSGRYYGHGLRGLRVLREHDASRYMPHYGAKEQAKYATAAPHRLGG